MGPIFLLVVLVVLLPFVALGAARERRKDARQTARRALLARIQGRV